MGSKNSHLEMEIEQHERELADLRNNTEQIKRQYELEHQRKLAEMENQRKHAEMGDQRKLAEMEHQRKIAEIEDQCKLAEMDHQRKLTELKNNTEQIKLQNEMEHQCKLAELIAQMKKEKTEARKEVWAAYMKIIESVIQQNVSVMKMTLPFLQELKIDPKDTIKMIQEINQTYGFMRPDQILEYAKKQIMEFRLDQDKEFETILDLAVGQRVINKKEKQYLLDKDVSELEDE
ncbi:hypothetical protein Glove_276g69 [Diversispora epigaea]|uniref:Uncharacterized protein n=1 Tax=Diversispora epigaea TaxID=1348612 RepID=A0A397IAS7_9GLOM|nr:hypothetical protein Glove_276g69 [Diversispora epigaea]